MSKILDEHNVTFQQFYKLFVAEASGYGRFLGKLGQISKAEKKQIFANMHELDKLFIQLEPSEPETQQKMLDICNSIDFVPKSWNPSIIRLILSRGRNLRFRPAR